MRDRLEVLRAMKVNPRTRVIPMITLTSSREVPDIAESHDLAGKSGIVKPADFERFTDAVRTLGPYWILPNEPPQG